MTRVDFSCLVLDSGFLLIKFTQTLLSALLGRKYFPSNKLHLSNIGSASTPLAQPKGMLLMSHGHMDGSFCRVKCWRVSLLSNQVKLFGKRYCCCAFKMYLLIFEALINTMKVLCHAPINESYATSTILAH